MTNANRILKTLEDHPEGLDDDELSQISGVTPRQQVYQICIRLAHQGKIRRISIEKPGRRRKIHNFLPRDAPANAASNGFGASAHTPIKNLQWDEPADVSFESLQAESPSWKKRLMALSAATDRSPDDLLDEALKMLAAKIVKEDL